MDGLFQSPIFTTTAVIVSIIVAGSILIVFILMSIQKNEDASTCKAFNKILDSLEYFQEFSLSVCIIIIGSAAYFYLDNYISMRALFTQYSSIIQIAIIAVSIGFMNHLSNWFQHTLEKDERCSIRLLGSIYSVLNLIIIRILTENIALDTTIICYISLILGRFVFFDSSLSSIQHELQKLGGKVILLPVMGVIVLIMMLYYEKQGILSNTNMIYQFVILYIAILVGLHAAREFNTRLFRQSLCH